MSESSKINKPGAMDKAIEIAIAAGNGGNVDPSEVLRKSYNALLEIMADR